MKKIAILALHLGTGGIENSIASLANILSKKYDVKIISTYKLNNEPSFFIDDKVEIKYLITKLKPNKEELKNAIKSKNIFKILKELYISLKVLFLRKFLMKKEIKKLDSDIIISTRYFHNLLLGKYAKKGVIKIAQEHNHHNNDCKYINRVINSLKNIDYFMPVSKELTEFYYKKLKNTKTKCIYIPHSLEKYPDIVSNLQEKNIISVGRLSPEKGFIDLIDIFKLVHDKHLDWKLNIVGDGSEKEKLIKKIEYYNLQDYIKLYGFLNRKELENLYLKSSIYTMTSFTESFGLVLIEAESYGIPIVVMDSAKGALEIVNNNENGIIINNRDKEEMVNKINYLIENIEERKRLGVNGRKNSKKYKKEIISNKWFKFIDSL